MRIARAFKAAYHHRDWAMLGFYTILAILAAWTGLAIVSWYFRDYTILAATIEPFVGYARWSAGMFLLYPWLQPLAFIGGSSILLAISLTQCISKVRRLHRQKEIDRIVQNEAAVLWGSDFLVAIIESTGNAS